MTVSLANNIANIKNLLVIIDNNFFGKGPLFNLINGILNVFLSNGPAGISKLQNFSNISLKEIEPIESALNKSKTTAVLSEVKDNVEILSTWFNTQFNMDTSLSALNSLYGIFINDPSYVSSRIGDAKQVAIQALLAWNNAPDKGDSAAQEQELWTAMWADNKKYKTMLHEAPEWSVFLGDLKALIDGMHSSANALTIISSDIDIIITLLNLKTPMPNEVEGKLKVLVSVIQDLSN